MGLETAFQNLAKKCAVNVFDSQVPCCGMAGDRGLLYPELPKSSLKQLQTLIQSKACCEGISTSRTCEIALSKKILMSSSTMFCT
jgi:D-lactate dehydrogenase